MTDGGPGARHGYERRGHERRGHGWRIAGFVALGVILVGGIATYFVWDRFLRNVAEPVDVAAVEKRFSSGASGGAARPGAGRLPLPHRGLGVGERARRSDQPLSEDHHAHGHRPPCGVDTRWDVLEGRYDGANRCRRRDGTWVLTGTTTSDRFFNQTAADTYTCPDIVDLPAAPEVGDTWKGTCTDTPASGAPDTTTSTYRVIGPETVRISSKSVDTVRLRITSKQGGQRSGGGIEHRWVLPGTNLIVRSLGNETDQSPSPVGSVTYQQRYDVRLQSLEPRT